MVPDSRIGNTTAIAPNNSAMVASNAASILGAQKSGGKNHLRGITYGLTIVANPHTLEIDAGNFMETQNMSKTGNQQLEGQAHQAEATETPQDGFNLEIAPRNMFNNEEIEKLRNLLNQLEPQVATQGLNNPSCSFVQTYNI